jgi:hypothetical protein
MHTGSVDNIYLTRQAATCRRLAAGISDDHVRAKLLVLAAEYDAQMLAVNRPGARPLRVAKAFSHQLSD